VCTADLRRVRIPADGGWVGFAASVVRLGRASEHGLKVIIARATAGDAIWFTATIDRIADILARHGGTDPVEVRRSKAIGILAQPAEALQLLCRHQDDDWDGAAEPTDPDQEPAEAQDEVRLEEAEPAARLDTTGTTAGGPAAADFEHCR
jgi:hypothetical protein